MRKIEDNFLKLFYDESKGFIVSSIDAGTLEKRDSFNSNAVKWENSYIRELLQSVGASGMDFFARHIVCKAGLREIPVWSEAFDAEANQMHSWWPVTGEYFMRLANEYDRRDLIDRWVGWISYWTKLLMCPEGVSCYLDTEEPDVDRWSSLKGSWYAYSMRGWYQAAIHGVVGVDIEAGGITFYPYSGEEMKLKGLHYKGGILDVEMKGSGRFIEAVVVNGHRITGTCKLPEDLLAGRKRSRIQVIRVKENPDEISVKHAYGAEFSEYSRENGRIRTGLRGSGTVRVVLAAEHKPEVRLDGVPVPAAYDAAAKTATVELFLPAGGMKTLEIQ